MSGYCPHGYAVAANCDACFKERKKAAEAKSAMTPEQYSLASHPRPPTTRLCDCGGSGGGKGEMKKALAIAILSLFSLALMIVVLAAIASLAFVTVACFMEGEYVPVFILLGLPACAIGCSSLVAWALNRLLNPQQGDITK